jgi:hypothetical protein
MVTASDMGKKGGQAKSEAKAAAARKNASKPRGKWATAIAYDLDGVRDAVAFGVVLVAGKPPKGDKEKHEWVCHQVRKYGIGIEETCRFEFLELTVRSRLL